MPTLFGKRLPRSLLFIIVALIAIIAMLTLYFFLKNEGFLGENVVIVPPPQFQGCGFGMPWWAYMLYCTGGGGYQAPMQPSYQMQPAAMQVPAAVPLPAVPVQIAAAPAASVPAAPAAAVVAATVPAAKPSGDCGKFTFIEIPGVKIDTNWDNWKYKIVGKKLTLNGTPINIKGINWYGFEEKSMIAELLYAFSMDDFFQALADEKINAIRVPFSAEFVKYFCDANQKLGKEGVIIMAVDGKPVKNTVAEGGKMTPAPESKNVVKYSGIMKEPELEGKAPVVALDKFLKLAYKYGMLVMMDLHTMNATPPWNDNQISAGWTVDIFNKELKDKLTEPGVKLTDRHSRKISDFFYPTAEPIFFQSWPYRDITQTELLNITMEDTVALWKQFATFCLSYPHVFAFDLKNEPHGKETGENDIRWQGTMADVHGPNFKIDWTNWSQACNLMYEGINSVHPYAMIVVEGLDDVPNKTNWGAGFSTMSLGQLNIPPEKLIYSPHQYGTLAGRVDTTDADWETNWGFLSTEGKCVMVGEWAKTRFLDEDRLYHEPGSAKNPGKEPLKFTAAEKQALEDNETDFMKRFVPYIAEKAPDSFYFAINWTSADTLALFPKDGAITKDPDVQSWLKTMQPSPTKLTFPFKGGA
jgi:aryl-phospho-beta-D-glucosidase BglC (GH1 family)